MNTKILPIAIDLGAKNTGVFSAFYDKGTALENLSTKQGKVYELSKDSYTLLMNSRTAKRHQRRGIDRKQLVKRLFKLIWTEKLSLEWDKDTQQTISFLLNRRGFSFLEEKHDASYFEKFPIEAIELLPQQLRLDINSDEKYDLNSKILETLENDTFKDVFDEIERNIKQVKKNIVKANITNLIKLAIDDKVSKGEIKPTKQNKFDDLNKVSLWIVDDLFDSETSACIDSVDSYSKNILDYLNALPSNQLETLKTNLPNVDINEYKNSVWNFNISSFNLDNEKLIEKLEVGDISAHLHHLGYALHNIKKELDEGSRHRSKYFEEVASVLLEQNHKEAYLKNFCQKLHDGKYQNLNVKNLVNLVGNLSNLELKPLRKYFNDKAHAKKDYWDEQRFAKTYCRWISGEWRVGSKDKDKKDGAKYSYKDLCDDLKREVGTTQNINGSIIEFLTELDPCRTIPPYQDNNNRKPPKCQSLILNSKFLDAKYPKWQSWVDKLKSIQSVKEYLANFEDDLKDLKTGKGQSYFVEAKSSNKQIASGQRDQKDLDARVLQFIFDRVKASDDLLLNEIYSQAKKVKQNASSEQDKQKAFDNLKAALQSSNLSNELKPERHFDKLSDFNSDIFEQGTFLHLVCKYFKHRQRARDSRLYIMPEYRYDKKLDKYNNTGRFDDDKQLLTYCNHKPRQKRYQLLNDLAGVLQVSNAKLLESVSNWLQHAQLSNKNLNSQDEKIFEWLKSFKIASYCKAAVDIQKQYRGTLKNAVQTAIFKQRLEDIKKNKKVSDDEKALLEKYKNAKALSSDEKKLVKLIDNIAKASQKIGENLGLDDKQIAKFNSVYSFAQIQQVAFVERNGNANTCAVCSADNAHRMQISKITELVEVKTDNALNDFDKAQSSLGAKAQRLPAIPTRIVDGAVKKMATIIARNIIDDNWSNIKQSLENKQELHIPIITESNAFEFEPSLAEIKGTKKKDRISSQKLFAKKENRIKNFAKGISAYSDTNLADGDYDGSKEELDHIIPRSHKKYGTLNDEANLICVTREDNQKRGNKAVYLSDLKPNYKFKQFGTTDDSQIEKYIAEKIWDVEKQGFKFGNYRSFINLTPEEQIAFRHALFLADDNPIKQAVIKAIDNRNRTFVNGTQRYFAEVLANNIYLRAQKEKLTIDKLSFDYFGVPTTDSNGRGIADIRKLYEAIDNDIQAYAKGDKPQDSYSHLIDAMLAFCVAAENHKNDGSIGLEMDNQCGLFPTPDRYDENTGEILSWQDDDIFRKIKVADSQFSESKLARRKATDGFNTHRQMTRDGIYAESYLPILIHKELDEVRKGFTWENSEELKIHKGKKYDAQQLNNLVYSLKFVSKPIILDVQINSLDELREILKVNSVQSTAEYYYLSLKTQRVHEYYIQNYNTALGYKKYSKEMEFLRSLAYRTERVKIKSLDDVNTVLSKDGNFKAGKVALPFKKEWQDLQCKWQNTNIKDDYEFLKSYFDVRSNTKNHQKVRKDFSLPIKTIQGNYLFKRKAWDNTYTFQILNNSDPRKDDVQSFIPVYDISSNQRKKGIIDAFVSRNIFMLSNDEFVKSDIPNIMILDRSKWYAIDITDELRQFGVTELCYRVDDNSRPSIKISYRDILQDSISQLCTNSLIKPNVLKDLKDQLERESRCNDFIYKGASFSNNSNMALNTALAKYYETFNS